MSDKFTDHLADERRNAGIPEAQTVDRDDCMAIDDIFRGIAWKMLLAATVIAALGLVIVSAWRAIH